MIEAAPEVSEPPPAPEPPPKTEPEPPAPPEEQAAAAEGFYQDPLIQAALDTFQGKVITA